ncbi:MAG: hypothetical protein HN576_15145 [Bacteriovoracaceae bacterium]|nr:hypothetical protein [Bacteriovoracaceae bacterium]
MKRLLNSHRVFNTQDIERYIRQFYDHDKIWLWQDSLNKNEKPIIHFAKLIKENIKSRHIEFRSIEQHILNLKPEQSVNILSPTSLIYFQCAIKRLESYQMMLNSPKEIFLLTQEIVNSWNLLPAEDELANKHLRQAPRVQAKISKRIGIQRAIDPMERVIEYPLYDMSQTGAGFLISHPSEFEVNQKLIIKTLDGKAIARKIRGEIKGIREMEDKNSFKVGIMFDTQEKSILS